MTRLRYIASKRPLQAQKAVEIKDIKITHPSNTGLVLLHQVSLGTEFLRVRRDMQEKSLAKDITTNDAPRVLVHSGPWTQMFWQEDGELTLGFPVLPLVYSKNKVSSASTHSTLHSFENAGTTSCRTSDVRLLVQ